MLFDHEQIIQPPIGFHLKPQRRISNCFYFQKSELKKTHRFRGEIPEISGETLVQPRIVPPRASHQIAEPMVALQLLDHHGGQLFEFRLRIVVDKQVFFPAVRNLQVTGFIRISAILVSIQCLERLVKKTMPSLQTLITYEQSS